MDQIEIIINQNDLHLPDALSPADLHGSESAEGLRQRTQYGQTEDKIHKNGITDEVLNETPPVALNLALLAQDEGMRTKLKRDFEGKSIHIAVFGIATANGIASIVSFAKNELGAVDSSLSAVDINPTVLKEVEGLNIPSVSTLFEDARNTTLRDASVDLLIRDHIGNCCPPAIDRAINKEALRVLRPEGWSITNISTSELLPQSPGRTVIPFSDLLSKSGAEGVQRLQEEFFDLSEITQKSNKNAEALRGILLEIEPNGSFAIFGSGEQDLIQGIDLVGHGEWFRSLNDHIALWKTDGFTIEGIKSRSGFDSHVPKLHCLRHIVLLQKNNEVI